MDLVMIPKEKYKEFDNWKCARVTSTIMKEVLGMRQDSSGSWCIDLGAPCAMVSFLPSRKIHDAIQLMNMLSNRNWSFDIKLETKHQGSDVLIKSDQMKDQTHFRFSTEDRNPHSLARCICQGILAVEFYYQG